MKCLAASFKLLKKQKKKLPSASEMHCCNKAAIPCMLPWGISLIGKGRTEQQVKANKFGLLHHAALKILQHMVANKPQVTICRYFKIIISKRRQSVAKPGRFTPPSHSEAVLTT